MKILISIVIALVVSIWLVFSDTVKVVAVTPEQKLLLESNYPIAKQGQLVLVEFPGDDQILRDTAKRRAELYEMLNTKSMTSEEVVETAKYGPLLNRNAGEAFNLNQKDLEIQNSLLIQILLTLKAK